MRSREPRVDYTVLAIPKTPPKRDRKLRAWIAQQECLVSYTYRFLRGVFPPEQCRIYKVHAAHVPTGTGGVGMKGDDLFVPLCFFHHIDVQHGMGTQYFQEMYGIDVRAEAEAYRQRYEQEAA